MSSLMITYSSVKIKSLAAYINTESIYHANVAEGLILLILYKIFNQ